MDEFELQVAKEVLGHEKKIKRELKKAFAESLKDVKTTIKELQSSIDSLKKNNADESLIRSKIYQIEYQEMLKGEIELNLDLLAQKNVSTTAIYLKKMYNDNYLGIVYDLQAKYKIPVHNPVSPLHMVKSVTKKTEDYTFSERLYSDVDRLKEVVKSEISRGIAQGNSYSKIAKRISEKYGTSYNNAYRIARTEGARVSTEAQLQSMSDSIEKGADLLKRWDATLDDRTRDTHAELDGQTVEYNEMFRYSGGEVEAPTMFVGADSAKENINCRCRLSTIPRWAVDKTATREDNIKGELIPYKTFTDWKKSYNKSF